MSDLTTDDEEKVNEYLHVIQERILAPIENTEVQQYCTATLLLLFAAIDGLGKIRHPSDKAGSNQRIQEFLDFMGGDYKKQKKKLKDLRNSLVHNAINVEAFLSRSEISDIQHLKKMDTDKYIYVNTLIMYQDFLDAYEKFRDEIKTDAVLMKQASERLMWIENIPTGDLDPNDVMPTPPPPIKFIHTKR